MLIKVEGFIVNTTNYGESSLIIQLLTKEYKIISVLGKGVKSMKNKLHALTLKYTYGFFYLYYKEGKLSILKDVDIIDSFKNIHNDLLRISYMTYYSDLTVQVIKESGTTEAYDLLITSLKLLNKGFDGFALANILETKYLNYLGIGLVLDSCVRCGSKRNIVTIADGGLICRNCYQNEEVYSLKVIKLIRLYALIDLKTITKININDNDKYMANIFLQNYYDSYAGLYLQSKKFLDKIKDYT